MFLKEGGIKLEENRQERRRVKFSLTTKGVVTIDTTYEAVNLSTEEVIKRAAELFDLAKIIADERTAKFSV